MGQFHTQITLAGATIAELQESLANSLASSFNEIDISATATTEEGSTKIEVEGYGTVELFLEEGGLVKLGIHNEDQINPIMTVTTCILSAGSCSLIVIWNTDALVFYFNSNGEGGNNDWAGAMLGTAVSTTDQTEVPCGHVIFTETSEAIDYSYNDFVEIQSILLPNTATTLNIVSPVSTGIINTVNMAPCILTGLTYTIKGCYASSEGIVGAIQDENENVYYCFGLLAMKI